MKPPTIFMALCALSLLFSACHNTRFEEQIKQMSMHPIKIQAEKLCLIAKNGSFEEAIPRKPFAMIYYIDSTQCTACTLNSIDDWVRELQPLFDSGELQSIIIVHPQKKEQKFMVSIYNDSELAQPIWMDTCGIFMADNPQIPNNHLFHKFMIDSLNNVVLIGNPAANTKLKQLAHEIMGGKIVAKP